MVERWGPLCMPPHLYHLFIGSVPVFGVLISIASLKINAPPLIAVCVFLVGVMLWAVLSGLCLGRYLFLICRRQGKKRLRDFTSFALAVVAFSLMAQAALQALIIPVQAWDAVDFWLAAGPQNDFMQRSALRHGDETRDFFILLQESGGVFNIILQLLWVVLTIGVGQVLVAVSLLGSREVWPGLAAFVLLASSPLVSAHMALIGYPELILLAAGTSTCALIIFAIEPSDYRLKLGVLAATASLLSVNVKSIGLEIPLSLFLALALCWKDSWNAFTIPKFAPAILVFTLALVAWLDGFYVYELGMGIDLGARTALFAGRELDLVLPGIWVFAETVATAMFVNDSFGVFFVAYLLVAAAFLFKAYDSSISQTDIFILRFCSIWLGTVLLSLFTDHGLNHAVPGNDTGFSRHLMVTMGALSLLISRYLVELALSDRRP